MKLRFIGANGSMGLNFGDIYDVTVHTAGRYIMVQWSTFARCQYESPQSFAENWKLP